MPVGVMGVMMGLMAVYGTPGLDFGRGFHGTLPSVATLQPGHQRGPGGSGLDEFVAAAESERHFGLWVWVYWGLIEVMKLVLMEWMDCAFFFCSFVRFEV